ncbi:MAG: Rpn family recombination-promoting nuclease/putative transposase [Pigmentiphaga sp.]
MTREDDASYKLLFSSPEIVRDLILGFVPDDWLHGLDYSTLEKVPGSYVSDDLRQRADDVIWRVRAEGQWVYLYLLIEFQSTVDPWMAVRVMTYVGLLYQDLIRRSQVLDGRKLPPVLPIVLYNGESRWAAATDVAELIPRAPGLVARYLPKLQYLLIDESQVSTMDLRHTRNLMAAIIQVERPASEQALLQWIDWLNDWLSDNPELRRTFAIWIRAVVLRQSRHTLALPKVRDLKELKMTLAERFDAWARQYENRGLAKGLAQGEALVLQRLLARRFGPLPADAIQAISTAPVEQVELWLDRLLDAQSLEDVLRP